MELSNKTILLTGATGGIGCAVAHSLAAEGANLRLVGRNAGSLNRIAEQLSGTHQIVVADITTAQGRQDILSRSIDGGGIDLLINLAGTMAFQHFEHQSEESIEQVLNTNLVAPMLLTKQLIPLLNSRPASAVINIGSIYGSIGHPGYVAYCASKSGLMGFTEALRRELCDTNVQVFYLAPRATDTALNSTAVNTLNRALGNSVDQPQQVADALIKLIRSNRHAEFMGWPEKLFVKINALLPRLVDHALVKKMPFIKQILNTQETTKINI
ncbi:SDR family oxidoreductase [Porticoccus sp.]|uniref:SDR family oxidoreductase n=1 Tax=Porticoccus sp. TaxID=2024853 RepID=UPI003F696B0C